MSVSKPLVLDAGTRLVALSGWWGWGSSPCTCLCFPKAVRNCRSSYWGRSWQDEGFAKSSFCQGVFLLVPCLCWCLYLWSLCCMPWVPISPM